MLRSIFKVTFICVVAMKESDTTLNFSTGIEYLSNFKCEQKQILNSHLMSC